MNPSRFFSLVLILLLVSCEKDPVSEPAGVSGLEAIDPQSAFSRVVTSEWQGKVLFINFWAEWCKPCIKEIPELNELHASNQRVMVAGYNFDRLQGKALQDVSARLGIHFPLLLSDPSVVFQDFPRVDALPVTVVIDPQGVIVATLRGPQTLEDLSLVLQRVSSAQQNGGQGVE